MSLLRETLAPFRPALALTVAMTLVTGVAYPALVTGIGKAAFPSQAGGSLVRRDGRIVGSALLGQAFTNPGYFWGRPSATAKPYDASASSGSNLGPANPALARAVADRVAALKAAGPVPVGPVPVDLVTASASGLDPDLSPAAARYQVLRVARVRGLPAADVERLVAARVRVDSPTLVGPPRVNVLALNLALDSLKSLPASRPAAPSRP